MKSRILFLFLISFVFLTCDPAKKITSSNLKDDNKIEIVLLQTNDVYEIAPLKGGKIGGMARVASLKNKLVLDNPNTLSILAGDFLYPSLIATMKYEGSRINGRQMIDAMNAAKIDLVTFGNHEFDISEEDLQNRLNESTFDWVSSNVLHNVDGQLAVFHKVQNGKKIAIPKTWIWEVKDKDGTAIKVGFFGVTLPSNLKPYVHYEDFMERALQTIEALKKEVDLVIGITHLNMEDDLILAKKTLGVPLFIGGHDHENIIKKVGETTVAKADANAKSAYVHKLVFDKTTKKASLKSKLHQIDESIIEDPYVAKVVKKWTDIANESFMKSGFDPNEIVAVANTPLDGREVSIRNHQTNLGKRITHSFFAAGKMNPDCAIMNSGSVRLDDQLHGNIYQFDIIRTLPFGGSVIEVELNGALFKKILDTGMNNAGTGGYLQWYNVHHDPTDKKWKIKDAEIKDQQNYIVAMNDFLLTGLEKDMGFFTKDTEGVIKIHKSDPNDKSDLRNDIRLATIDLMKKME